MTHTFIKSVDPLDRFDNVKVTVETDAVNLMDLVEAFADYLRACGFVFSGNLDIVNPEDDQPKHE